MAKVDKLALVRLALKQTIRELDTREKLCVLADMYAGTIPGYDAPRWYGNGDGTSGLEQGIYNYMTTFRRVSNLWMKMKTLSPDIKKETYMARDWLMESLGEEIANQIAEKTQDE